MYSSHISIPYACCHPFETQQMCVSEFVACQCCQDERRVDILKDKKKQLSAWLDLISATLDLSTPICLKNIKHLYKWICLHKCKKKG